MDQEVRQALERLFGRHRIVFWYDEAGEFRRDFDGLSLEGVEKVRLANDELALKRRMLRDEPGTRFLVYGDAPRPPDRENWLLDVLLAGREFRADRIDAWLAGLGLDEGFRDLVREHADFFRSDERLAALREALRPGDGEDDVRMRMLAVCAGGLGSDADDVALGLLHDLADGKDTKMRLISRCGLGAFLWGRMEAVYGYRSGTPGPSDFALWLFGACHGRETGGEPAIGRDAVLLMGTLRNDQRHRQAFGTLSALCAGQLGVGTELEGKDFRGLVKAFSFEEVDRAVVRGMVRVVADRTVGTSELDAWIAERKASPWWETYGACYDALGCASRLLDEINRFAPAGDTVADMAGRYADAWFRMDQLHRLYWHHVRESRHAQLFRPVGEAVEGCYVNRFLRPLGDRFQEVADAAGVWDDPVHGRQDGFWDARVRPLLARGAKACVVVSDALRYEIGEELAGRIRRENRFEARVEPMLAMLPSCTQLGMAALLPHGALSFAEDGDGTVLSDGLPTQGVGNRRRMLAAATGGRAAAYRYEEFRAMDTESARAAVRDHDVLYVFHNAVDAFGDKLETEDRVCGAAETAVEELTDLVKKLANANASNVIVTADHGFLYQDAPVEGSDFASCVPEGGVLYRGRRFVLGRGLRPQPGLTTLAAADLGCVGTMEVQMPKGLGRLRLSGSGSRYVHGGASLQEAVVPVVVVSKRRQDDVGQVSVRILDAGPSVIATGQLTLRLYQDEPVADKRRPLHVAVFLQADDGTEISRREELDLDAGSESPRDRERTVTLVLTRAADAFNNRTVVLRLERRIEGTSRYVELETRRYTLRRMFGGDFDF